MLSQPPKLSRSNNAKVSDTRAPNAYLVCALYRFATLDNYAALRQPLLDLMLSNDVRGTLLLAQEGVNGTICGESQAVSTVLDWLRADERLTGLTVKESYAKDMPFYRTKVKLKKEIVTMGVEGVDPKRVVGTYVKPQHWNELISDPEVLLIDTRNDYEVKIGRFESALNPNTKTFREFPDYVEQQLDPTQHKKIAMYCTGGIRCEKSTAYLKSQGFEEVYHLEGGILKYLEEVPESESLWRGECFVFDNRVTVNHALEPGSYDQCNACRMPITEAEKETPQYEKGVSCPHCFGHHSPEQIERFKQREKQVMLAAERGEEHIGGRMQQIGEKRRLEKLKLKAAHREMDKDLSKPAN